MESACGKKQENGQCPTAKKERLDESKRDWLEFETALSRRCMEASKENGKHTGRGVF